MISRKIIIFLVLILVIIFSIISLTSGPIKISIKEIFYILFNQFGFLGNTENDFFSNIQESVLINIRFPRVILAILVGAGLGTSGAILQGLFRNPLVDPGFIGVSSGAAVGAIISIMFGKLLSNFLPHILQAFLLPILAIIGSFLTIMIVYSLSKVNGKTNVMAMLLSGVAINAIAGSIIGFFVSISSDLELRSFTFWTMGGLDNSDWFIVILVSFFTILPFLFIYKFKTEIDIFMLGDSEAANLGVNVEYLKRKIILISSIMVGISVAFCGMIGFVGLVTPHLIRLFISPNHKYLIPGSALLGSLILVLSDFISKTIISPAQLPIGIVTSAIGAPFFVWLILSQKRRFSYSE
tara:strand:- start:1107 stop:2165 length:1059 start_codon:yes stop_codon:yes gene_type:complete